MPVIETNVVIARGQEEFFDTMDFDFDPKLFMIVDIHTWIEVYHTEVIKGNKVIFNGFLYKNIIYKTKECAKVGCKPSDVTIKGDVKQQTRRQKIEGFIPVELIGTTPINRKTDKAIVLCAEILGEVEEKLGEEPIIGDQGKIEPPMYTYCHLHEKVCYTIRVKVVRDTMLDVNGTVFSDPGCITSC